MLRQDHFVRQFGIGGWMNEKHGSSRTLERTALTQIDELRGGIRVVQRHYPLDTTRNPHAKRSRHPGSCRLALAAICAGMQGKYTELSDALFTQEAPADLERIARSLGLDADALESCMKSDDANRTLLASIDAAAREVHATPTLFINGTRHVGRLDDADLRCLATGAAWIQVRATQLAVHVGEVVRLRFSRMTGNSCAREVIVSLDGEHQIRRELPVGIPVDIVLRFERPGELGFSCGMAMLGGSIDVRAPTP